MSLIKSAGVFLLLQSVILFINVYGSSGCPFSALTSYMGTAYGTQVDQSKMFLMQVPGNSSEVSVGSNATVSCSSGYTNTGGPLTIVCQSDNTWTQFPKCSGSPPPAPATSAASPPATSAAPAAPAPAPAASAPAATGGCSLDQLNTYFGTAYGTQINQQATYIGKATANSTQALVGSNVTVSCSSGYTNTGGPLTIVCQPDNTWTSFPKCSGSPPAAPTQAPSAPAATGGCSLDQLNTYFGTAYNTQINQQATYIGKATANSTQALVGSNVTVACSSGYTNTGGPLTIVCQSDNTWTSFPKCSQAPASQATPVDSGSQGATQPNDTAANNASTEEDGNSGSGSGESGNSGSGSNETESSDQQ